MLLFDTEKILKEVQQVAELGVWEWSVRINQVTWSEGLFRLYGETPGSYQPSFEGYIRHVHPDERGSVRETILKSLRDKGSFSQDERIIRADGKVRWLHTWGHAIVSEDGELMGMIGVCQDVTDSHEYKAKLEDLVSLQTATIEATADGILVVGSDGRIVSWNQRLLDIWQIPESVVKDKPYQEAFEIVRELLTEPEACSRRLEEIMAHADQESRDVLEFKTGTVLERFSRPRRVENQIVGRVFSYRDITERIHAEESARSNSERLQALVETSRIVAEAKLDLQAILDRAVRRVSEFFGDGAFIRLLSPTGAELETQAYYHVHEDALDVIKHHISGIRAFIDPQTSKRVIQTHQPILVSGSVAEATLRLHPEVRPWLAKYPVHSWIVSPLRVAGKVLGVFVVMRFREGRYTPEDVAFMQDMSDRVALAISNAAFHAETVEAVRLRDEFIRLAAHELRTPLTTLTLILHHLRKAVQDVRTRELVQTALDNVGRLHRSGEELLAMAELSQGMVALTPSRSELTELVLDVVRDQGKRIAAAGSRVEVVSPSSVSGSWDRQWLRSVIESLLASVMAVGRGQPIVVRVLEENGRAKLVLHTGEDGRQNSANAAGTERARLLERLGLHLYVAEEIVKLHGGRLQIHGDATHGITLVAELPLVASEGEKRPHHIKVV